jgi:hypothetical protein
MAESRAEPATVTGALLPPPNPLVEPELPFAELAELICGSTFRKKLSSD